MSSELCAGEWLANGKPFFFYISWPSQWKTHIEETGSWRWSSLISEHVHWEIINFLHGLHFVEGWREHSPRQVAEFAYLCKRDSSSLGNAEPQDLYARKTPTGVMTDVSVRESLWGLRNSFAARNGWRTPDNVKITPRASCTVMWDSQNQTPTLESRGSAFKEFTATY